ncbi:hypothetical protein PILCRDRAFT_245641 [Piloderma croceum F 1598]|uniref:FAD-binding domain-containing protein n=1 Tax=Piloderma croceum (strain F 1598) TaxID=765440 RepID=A0A0C3FXE2_PILCF|nr:hypothetical protein PILCRDRAFT_245641 [Piloderma croceum F 1598]
MTSPRDLKIAIIGGGMCGLACAVGLVRAGIPVEIFEAAPKFEEVGAGVGLGPNAIRALTALGVMDAVQARADQPKPTPRPYRVISGMPGHEHVYDFSISDEDCGLGIHRAAFLDALVELVDPNITHFNKRCTSISKSSTRSTVHFSDGSTHEADVIIGADGIRSAVRGSVVDDKHLAFTNAVAYRGLVSAQTLKDAGFKTNASERPINFVGNDKHVIAFPMRSGQTINIVAFARNRQIPMGFIEIPPGQSWVTPVSKQDLLDEFSGWGSDVMALLGCIQKPSKWSLHAVYPPLETYVSGNIALIGDSAHAMLPHLGAGVGEGFEDVLVLCRLLSEPQTNASNVASVLQAYDNVRRPRANMVQQASTIAGDIYEGYGKPGFTVEEMRERLSGIWDPIWHHDLEADIAKAVQSLKENGSFV